MARLDINEITREYFPRIQRAALVLTGNPWDADDLAQETFLVFAEKQQTFRGQSALFTWLYGILINLERRERRRETRRRHKLQTRWQNEPGPEPTPAADAAAQVSEWKQSLWARVHTLPDGQRQTLVLRFSESLSYEEIAVALDCPVGTVKSRIFHGLAALKKQLDEQTEFQELPTHPYADVTEQTR